jgi:hypothetical protein
VTLPDAVTDALPPDDTMRIGTVLSVNPLVVDVQGNPTPAGWIALAAPIAGKPVALLRLDATWLALGILENTATPSDMDLQVTELTAQSGFVNTAFATGSPACQLTFTCPSSGQVKITWGGYLLQNVGTNETQLGFQVIDAASNVAIGASVNRLCAIGRAVNASAAAIWAGSRTYLTDPGVLTPGRSYTIQTVHRTTPAGNGIINERFILMEASR